MSHVGLTLRRLRLESGLSLRDLARRLGVSSAYVSRVEHGLDAAPTSERLEAFAAELGLPASALLETGHRVGSYLERYLEQEPQAASLFGAIARRGLGPDDLAEIQRFVERRFGVATDDASPSLAPRLARERVLVGVRCADLGDVCELAAARMASLRGAPPTAELAALLLRRIETVDPNVGEGVAVVSVAAPGVERAAAMVGLARPLAGGALDGSRVGTVVVLLHEPRAADALVAIAHVARLGARGLDAAVRAASTPRRALEAVERLERLVAF